MWDFVYCILSTDRFGDPRNKRNRCGDEMTRWHTERERERERRFPPRSSELDNHKLCSSMRPVDNFTNIISIIILSQ